MTGIVSPEEIVGADGLPGCSSTNQLPSRKIRGRIFSVASEWIGRPCDSISIVTRPVLPSRLIERDLADVDAGDPHRRFGVDVERGREHGVQAEAVFERDVLGEAEVDDDHDDHDRARSARRGPGSTAAARRRGLRRGGATSAERSFPLPRPCFGLGLAFSASASLRDPERLERRGRVLFAEQVLFAAREFAVVRDGARGQVADHGLPALRDCSSRCPLRRPAAGRGRRRSGRGSTCRWLLSTISCCRDGFVFGRRARWPAPRTG